MDALFGFLARFLEHKLWVLGLLAVVVIGLTFVGEGVTWQTVVVGGLMVLVLCAGLLVGAFWVRVFRSMGSR